MLRYTTNRARPGLVTLYDIRPGNGAGQFLQPRNLHGAAASTATTTALLADNILRKITFGKQDWRCRIIFQDEYLSSHSYPCDWHPHFGQKWQQSMSQGLLLKFQTSCARGDTICPRPSHPRGRPSASCTAEQTQRSSTFQHRIRSHADRCGRLTR